MNVARRLAPLLAAAMLGGCATLPTGTDGLSLEQRREALQSVDTWEMRGRLTVDTGERAFQGSFNWRQQDDALELVVRGPLRNGVLQVEGRPDALTVHGARRDAHADGSRGRAVRAHRLVAARRELAGLAARLSRRRLSRRHGAGRRRHARLARATALARRLSGLRARGDERRTGSEVLVPRRIDMTHGALTLKLTIDDWQPAATTTAP